MPITTKHHTKAASKINKSVAAAVLARLSMAGSGLLLFAFTTCGAFTLAQAQEAHPDVTRTADYVAKFVTNNKATVENSLIFDNGTDVGVATSTPAVTLDVNGTINAATGYNLDEEPFAIGSYANQNAFFGFSGNSAPTGTTNTAAGYQALAAVTTGSWNEAIGGQSLLVDTTGHSNAALGLISLPANTSGSYNVALGNRSLYETTTGYWNVGVGYYGGQILDGSAGTGDGNTTLGSGSAISTGSLTNATAIGWNAEVSLSDSLVLGCVVGSNGCTGAVNVGIGITDPTHPLHMGDGAYEQGGTWVNNSDRNLKENFVAIDGAQVLSKINEIPIDTWNYKANQSVRHMGPVAQDFRAAFGLGDDDKHISTVDEGGVALAGVQELYRMLLQKSQEIATLKEANRDKDAQIQQLSARVDELQQMQQILQVLSTRLAKIENADYNVSTLRSSR